MIKEDNLRLTQVDFYGILSRHTTTMRDEDSDNQGIYDLIDESEHPEVYLDRWLRTQLYGYGDIADPNLVRKKIEQEPIPLRSIRVPLSNGLSSAWAPNGYGKTYIFSHLEKLKGFFGITPSDRLRNGWMSSAEDIAKDYPTNERLVPYHALGLKVKGDASAYHVLWVAASNKFFLREISDHTPLSDVDGSEPGWCYSPAEDWTELEFPDMFRRQSGRQSTSKILFKAVDLYTNLDVVYHETPSESDKIGFSVFLERLQTYLSEYEPLDFGGARDDWFAKETSWKSYTSMAGNLTEQLRAVEDHLSILCDPFSLFSSYVDIQHERRQLQSFEHDAESEEQPSEHMLRLLTLNKTDIASMETIAQSLVRILFTTSSIHQPLRIEIIRNLYAHLQDVGDSCHPLYEYLDTLLMEYACVTGGPIPSRSPDHQSSPWLEYRTISLYIRMLEEDSRYWKNEYVVDFDEMPNWLGSRISTTRIDPNGHDSIVFDELRNHAWDCLTDGFSKAMDAVTDAGILNPLSCNVWPLVFAGSINPSDLPTNSAREDFEALHTGLLSRLNHADKVSDVNKTTFFPKYRPQPINIKFLEEEINRCLNPRDFESNPWAVRAEFSNDNLLEFSPLQALQERPDMLQERPDMKDIVHPHHLSFGMRSEVTLQCSLAMFAHKNRLGRSKQSSSYQLLILDEPEIGRSEYWVQLLIERLERLAMQTQESENSGILLVSHRDKVARQGSPTGTYPAMQKVSEKDLAELDEDW